MFYFFSSEVEGKSSHYGLDMLGYTRVTKVFTGGITVFTEIYFKNYLSSDQILKFKSVKLESLVIVNKIVTMNFS